MFSAISLDAGPAANVSSNTNPNQNAPRNLIDWDNVYRRLPLFSALDDIGDRPFYREVIQHSTFDACWKSYSMKGKYGEVEVPAYFITGLYDNLVHEGFKCFTGWKSQAGEPREGRPNFGSWISRHQGKVNESVPPNVSLMYPTGHSFWGQTQKGGFLGLSHAPFGMVEKDPTASSSNMVLQGITLERLLDRDGLRRSFDQFRREIDRKGTAESIDVYQQQALGILTTTRLSDALDLSQEDPKVLERYGENDVRYQRDGAPKMVRNFCIARRLVEAGARVVSMNYSRWDWHGPDGLNFPRSRQEFPLLD